MDDMDDAKPLAPKTPGEINASVYHIAARAASGVTQGKLSEMLPSVSVEQLATAIATLLSEGKLNYFHDNESSTVKYFARSAEQAQKFQDLGAEEMTLYQLIKAEGRMGIWTRNLKIRSGLTQVRIRKLLLTLEGRGLIKAVKSITAKNRKMYMLAELQPDPSHYGGPWYTDSEFDAEFFKVLSDSCMRYISKNQCVTADDVRIYIKQSNISRVELTIENVRTIINTLIYDGKVDPVRRGGIGYGGSSYSTEYGSEEGLMYRPTKLSVPHNEMTNVPCGLCPVAHLCSDEGDITPAKCPYLEEWLDY